MHMATHSKRQPAKPPLPWALFRVHGKVFAQQSLCRVLRWPMVKNNTRQKFESKKLETNGKKNLIGEGPHRLAPNNKVASRGIFSRNIHVLHGIWDSNPRPPLAPNLLYRSTTFSLVFISDFFPHILY